MIYVRSVRLSIAVLCICGAAALAGAAAGALPRRALVVPGHSLAGVRLGMSIAQVERLWGAPNLPCGSGFDGRYYCGWYPPGAKTANGIDRMVTIASKRPGAPVVLVDDSFYPGWKTARGIGVGSKKGALLRAYGKALVAGHVGGAPMLGLKTVVGGRNVWTWFKLSARDHTTIIEIVLTPRRVAPL